MNINYDNLEKTIMKAFWDTYNIDTGIKIIIDEGVPTLLIFAHNQEIFIAISNIRNSNNDVCELLRKCTHLNWVYNPDEELYTIQEEQNGK